MRGKGGVAKWPIALFTVLLVNIAYGQSADLHPLFEKYGIPVYEQGKRGTCSVFAVTGLLEFEYAQETGQYTPLSVEFLNWASNQVTGGDEDGSYFSDALKALKKYGICESWYFPYNAEGYVPGIHPPKTAKKDAKKRRKVDFTWIKQWDATNGMSDSQIREVKENIKTGHPVAIGFRWPKKDEKYRKQVNGVMYIPPEEGVFDGHSVIIVGYEDNPDIPGGGYFIFKNSHGTGNGGNGYGKMPYGYVQKYANDGIVICL